MTQPIPSLTRNNPMRQRWPSRLWLVRHGESAGNVARAAADSAGIGMIDIHVRDVDVPLSALGRQQAEALGLVLARLPEEEGPQVVLPFPFLRAAETAAAFCGAGGVTADARKLVGDERLREREFGIWDRL